LLVVAAVAEELGVLEDLAEEQVELFITALFRLLLLLQSRWARVEMAVLQRVDLFQIWWEAMAKILYFLHL